MKRWCSCHLPKLFLGIFLLVALPLQTIAAMNSVQCANTHATSALSNPDSAESTAKTHAHFSLDCETIGTDTAGETTAPTGFTCGHGAPCCFGAALVSTLPTMLDADIGDTTLPRVTAHFADIPPNTFERPPRFHLA